MYLLTDTRGVEGSNDSAGRSTDMVDSPDDLVDMETLGSRFTQDLDCVTGLQKVQGGSEVVGGEIIHEAEDGVVYGGGELAACGGDVVACSDDGGVARQLDTRIVGVECTLASVDGDVGRWEVEALVAIDALDILEGGTNRCVE